MAELHIIEFLLTSSCILLALQYPHNASIAIDGPPVSANDSLEECNDRIDRLAH